MQVSAPRIKPQGDGGRPPGERHRAIALAAGGIVVAGAGEIAVFLSPPVGLGVVLLGLVLAVRGLRRL